MARFKDMHSFVKLVRDHDISVESDNIMRGLTSDKPFLRLMRQKDAVENYASANKKTIDRATEVCEDAIQFNYIRVIEHPLKSDNERLKVLPLGRHLLERGGTFRAWADNNKNPASFILTGVAGVLLGLATFIFNAIGQLHR